MQVQGTNDSSIVSKLSSASLKYFEDDCLKFFVAKQQRRSPIINRGYYIRFKAIEAVFESWFSILSSDDFQIVSLGAGFDSSFFRLKKQNKLPKRCKYFEIDYPEVMQRKLNCISSSDLFLGKSNPCQNSCIVFSNEEYAMIGQDLKNCEVIEKCFIDSGMVFSRSTLFLSECAVTYMDVESSNSLIGWIQRKFPNSTFVTYEQVYPNDGFGIVMQNHFTSLQCPLKSVLKYPNEEQQCLRYKESGWDSCHSITMFDYFMSLSENEKERIQNLELFDEYEMWHEKCHHYILIWASQGTCSSSPLIFSTPKLKKEYSILSPPSICWKQEESDDLLSRFGHEVSLVSPNHLIIIGGFGEVKKKHQRLGGVVVFNLLNKTSHQPPMTDPGDLLGKRMYHSMTKLSNGNIVVIGGRSSPSKVFKEVVAIQDLGAADMPNEPIINQNQSRQLETDLFQSISVEKKTEIPSLIWRHSASLVEIEGTENIVIFGGCMIEDSRQDTSNECFILNCKTWNWSKVPLQEHTPSPRHSHSSVVYDQTKLVVTCGLSKNETLLNSVHIFDSRECTWSTLNVAGLLPRYSHTSHFHEGNIILVGGITSVSSFPLSIGIINLSTLMAIECCSPAQDPEYPLILSSHCSFVHDDCIVIIGGGGNCFSFGTHFNSRIIKVEFGVLSKIMSQSNA